MKFKNHAQPLSPGKATRHAQHVANFSAGQAAYNQLLRNIQNYPKLVNERDAILRQVRMNQFKANAIHQRLATFPPSLHGSELRKIANIQARLMPSYHRTENLTARIRQLKRRILNMVPHRFHPAGHHHLPYTNWVLNAWSPNRLIAALQLRGENKLRKQGLRYTMRPNGPTSLRLFKESNANLTAAVSARRKRPASTSPLRNVTKNHGQ